MFRSKRTAPAGGFSVHTRAAYLDRLPKETFDLVVVGGGITGAAIARDAVLRGLSVALLEKGDFAVGTSSRSSKMVHGGLRYLKDLHIRLVRESLHERGRLLRLAPHLVRPVPFLMPVYQGGPYGRLKLRLGLIAYDVLAGSLGIGRHRTLSREKMLIDEPLLRREGLKGGFRFYDCLTNDARLTLATVRTAAKNGAVAVNYVEATALEREGERVAGVRFRDRINGREGAVRARVVVNATGPWSDQIRAMGGLKPVLRPSKGIHVVFPRSRLGLTTSTVIARGDRIVFAIPYGDCAYVGTTDTDYKGAPGDVVADADDVKYLVDAVNDQFDGVQVSPADIISSWAGVRPLVADEGSPTPSDVSRDFIIEVGPEGMYSITGGKLTTCRSMAEALVNRVLKQERGHFGWQAKPCSTRKQPLIGGDIDNFERYAEEMTAALAEKPGIPPAIAYRLLRAYGTEHVRVLAYAERDADLLHPLADGSPVLKAEALFAAEEEMALTLEDFMLRRTELMLFDRGHGLDASQETARLMGGVLGWDER
ncbi:MAG: glycerol-3-phosphate dehydrogenase, partial [Dehalococcoidia bacterium]|nr:glycerol-3-phosphate dehydrogenase [Dehalococcoidia bacterium]